MKTTKHGSRPFKTALRNALDMGYMLPNVEGTGIFMRLGTHHVRCFGGDVQLKSLVKQGLMVVDRHEDLLGLPVYVLTKKGIKEAQKITDEDCE